MSNAAFFIDTVLEADAESLLLEQYQANLRTLGYVTNYTRAFSLRPEVMRAWQGLIEAIAANLNPRDYELATLAAATALLSSYCSLAHGKVLQRSGNRRVGEGRGRFAHARRGRAHSLCAQSSAAS